jgi:hypothetical protein
LTPTIKVRAADVTGKASPILGVFGLMAFPTDNGQFDEKQTVINNFAQSQGYLFNLNGTAVEDRIAVHKEGLDSVVLVTIGPYTNDMTVGDPAGYYANMVDLARHYSRSPVLIIGAFEQQAIEAYPSAVMQDSPVVTLSSGDGNLTQSKDGGSEEVPGRSVWVTGYPNGGGGLAPSTNCQLVTSRNSCVLSSTWTGGSGRASLTFGGRDIETQDAFRARAKAAAADVGCAYLDLRACWGSFRTAYAAGLMAGALHESQKGHRDIPARIQRLVQVVV